jgi:serpin B
MMQNTAHYSYFENEIMQSIRLEYARDTSNVGLSAIVILPREHQLLTQVIDQTRKPEFNSILNTLYTGESISRIKLSLPKFTVSFAKELNSILFQMGLKNAFIGGGNEKAELNGISNGIYIEKILQRVFIKVDEGGTEAAASSAVVFKRSLPLLEPEPELLVNRPFLFYIVDDETKHTLFLAYMENMNK